MKIMFLSTFFLAVAILISGCSTTTRTVGGATMGFSTGIVKDIKDAWEAVEKADNWIKENYW